MWLASRLLPLAIAALALACAKTEADTPTPASGEAQADPAAATGPSAASGEAADAPVEATTAAEAAPTDCEPLGGPDTVSLRLVSQASHAGALHDVTWDLEANRLRGDSYTLNDSTPVPHQVDTEVEAARANTLRKTLAELCVVRVPFDEDQAQAPGGYTALQVKERDGGEFWISAGPASIPAPGKLASVEREQWDRIVEPFPEIPDPSGD